MHRLPLNRGSRLLWAVLGTALVAAGSRQRSVWDAGCGVLGATMLFWTFAAPAAPEKVTRDIVDTMSEDSFPASDSPSTW